MGHATSDMIVKEFLKLDLDLTKILQLSMDGPNVNFSVWDSLDKEINVSLFL